MLLRKREFYLTPIVRNFTYSAEGEPLCSLTCDRGILRFVANLPYIGEIYPGNRSDSYVLIFDRRYDVYEAWHELNRELTIETQKIDLDPIWQIEGENDDDEFVD